MTYAYECQKCGEECEIECKLAEKEQQLCPFCGAPPSEMKSIINLNTKTYGSHVSWSQWSVGE